MPLCHDDDGALLVLSFGYLDDSFGSSVGVLRFESIINVNAGLGLFRFAKFVKRIGRHGGGLPQKYQVPSLIASPC
jgi:hypothetical protein